MIQKRAGIQQLDRTTGIGFGIIQRMKKKKHIKNSVPAIHCQKLLEREHIQIIIKIKNNNKE